MYVDRFYVSTLCHPPPQTTILLASDVKLKYTFFSGQVKNEWLHNAGVGVVAHVADSLKQQESSSCISASL